MKVELGRDLIKMISQGLIWSISNSKGVIWYYTKYNFSLYIQTFREITRHTTNIVQSSRSHHYTVDNTQKLCPYTNIFMQAFNYFKNSDTCISNKVKIVYRKSLQLNKNATQKYISVSRKFPPLLAEGLELPEAPEVPLLILTLLDNLCKKEKKTHN